MPLDNLDSAIDPTHAEFTVGFILDNLASVGKLGLNGLANVHSVNSVRLNSGGFLSDIYRIRIQLKETDNGTGNITPTTFTCILKVPTSRHMDTNIGREEDREAMKVWMYMVHTAECRFYTTVVPLLRAMPLPPPFRIPELYACRSEPSLNCLTDGYLLMEDVSGHDVFEIDLFQGLNKAQTESAIRGLAHYHALCLCLPRELVDSFTLKNELNFDEKELHVSERLMAMPDSAQCFAGQKEALQKLYAKYGQYEPDQHKFFAVAPVIVHGDYWSNNIFFKTNQDKNVVDQLDAVFDWQICHTGTGVNDLLRIIYVSVDAPSRRLHFDDWLSLYWSELHSVLSQLGKQMTDQQQQEQKRSLGLIQQLAALYSGYELCFQLFLFTNILGTLHEKEEAPKREKLIKRMRELYDDVMKNCFNEE